MRYVNARGERASRKTEKPDFERCQAFPNMLSWSSFSLGPRPSPVRCEGKPSRLMVENHRRDDGLIGSMTVCDECFALFRKHASPSFAKVYKL
jgi:hypothetical protein